jgi:multisubunit Na+/H+ antiporter MnhG subunit
MREAIVAVLLFSGVALELFCCLGVVAMRGPYDRLHYTAPAGFGAVLVAGAILVHEGFSMIADKALLLAALLVFLSPFLVYVTARSARIRELGDIHPEREKLEER